MVPGIPDEIAEDMLFAVGLGVRRADSAKTVEAGKEVPLRIRSPVIDSAIPPPPRSPLELIGVTRFMNDPGS